MGLIENIINDSYNRFKGTNWQQIAADRIKSAYDKKGKEPTGHVTTESFNKLAARILGWALIGAVVIISILILIS